MTKFQVPIYDYFEERGQDDVARHRRRNVHIEFDLPAFEQTSVSYGMRRTRELEGEPDGNVNEGVWPINFLRVQRYWGSPNEESAPQDSVVADWPSNIDELASQLRVHHYHRIRDVETARELVARGGIAIAIEVSSDWYNPKGGRIPYPYTSDEVGGVHYVSLIDFDVSTRSFVFINSWGGEWGDNGIGYLHESLFQHVICAWRAAGIGLVPKLEAKDGLVSLLWKSNRLDGVSVHGREIVDAGTGQRLAWAFLTRYDSFIDIEEFFVWPSARGRGLGRELAELVQELASQMKKSLRAWVPFPDSEKSNRSNLMAFLRLMKLNLHPSPVRWAGFLANREGSSADVVEPQLPRRPSASRESILLYLYRSEPQIASFGGSDEEKPRLYRVWFGTNRKPIHATRPSDGFTNDRDDETHLGYCDVAVPKSHRFGSIGTPWWKRLFVTDDERLWVKCRCALDAQTYWGKIREALTRLDLGSPDCLIYIHGYNVTFDAAAIRAAQIGFDLKIPLTAFFSWASKGTLFGYAADEESIQYSEPFIAEYLDKFVINTGAKRIHVLAHSMGNRGLIRAIERTINQMSWSSARCISQIILAAPDIDADIFRQMASLYGQVAVRTTLYASPRDVAVRASQMLHNYERAGLSPPVTIVPNVDTIVVPTFDVFNLLGHGYYADAEPVLYDMFDLIQRNAAPSSRLRLQQKTVAGLDYWEFGV